MLKSFTRTTLGSVALTMGAFGKNFFLAALILGASSLAPSAARAELKPIFDQLLLYNSPATLPTVEVEAEGQDWTRVSTETLHVSTSYYVSLKKGDILSIIATPGPDITQSRFPGGGKRRWGEFNFELPKSSFDGRAILACNQNKQSGANTNGTHTTYVGLGFKLFVGAGRVGNPGTKLVDGDVQAKVVCKKAPKSVAISHFAVKVDNSTDTCPKNAVVQVGFSTNRDDRIDFTLEHVNDGRLNTSEHFVQPFLIGGQYTATKLIDLVVDSNTEYVEVRLKDGSDSRRWRPSGPLGITCPRAFKVTSLWLTYDVENKVTCPKKVVEKVTGKATAPGQAPFEIKTQGGLVVHSGTADFKLKGMEYVAEFGRDKLVFSNAFESDMMALIKNQPANSGWVKLKVDCLKVLSGTLDLRGFAATRCEGQGAIAIHTNGPGNVPYQLACTGGKSWSRTAQAMQTGPNTYIGVDTMRFDVTNNEQVNCALKTAKPMPVKVLALKGRKYECHKPTDAGASDDLAPDTRPDPQQPNKPGTAVVDPVKPDEPKDEPDKPGTAVVDPLRPKISCAGGAVKDGACVCERTHKPVKAGKNAWRCVKVAVDPKPDKPIVSEPKISCAGGTVKNGACACARTHKPVKAGQNAWRCVKAVGDPPRNKDGANKLELKTAPKKTATPKLGVSDKGGSKGKGKAAKKGNGSSAVR